MKSSLLLLVLVVGVVAVILGMPGTATAVHIRWGNKVDDPRMRVGGLYPVDSVDHPKIQGLGEWAVLEHVKRANNGLKFVKVVSSEAQLVAGTNYWLVIQAINGNGVNGTYKAWVYEQSWTNTLELVSFVPAN